MTKRDWNTRANAYFTSFLRRIFRWSPAYKACRAAAFDHAETIIVGGKRKRIEYYRCAKCGEIFKRRDTHVDHKIPFVSPERGREESWDRMRARMSMENTGNLQILCRKTCHKGKTAGEGVRRKRQRAEKA